MRLEFTGYMLTSPSPMAPPPDIQAEPGKTVAFRTIGCKLNQCETAQMQESLLAEGYRLVDWSQTADIRVINTCTVTAKSDRTCRHEIRLAKRVDPESTVVVTGCYAQIDPAATAAIPGVDLVLGNLDKLRIAEYLEQTQSRPQAPGAAADPVLTGGTACPTLAVTPYTESQEFEGEFFSHFYGYTRAFLKIQTGCDCRCAYCIIPLARGPARSMAKTDVLREMDLLGARGFREVVLTGINLGSWGTDTGEGSLAELLAALLAPSGDPTAPQRVPNQPPDRFRLSSIEPLEVNQALMDVVEGSGDRIAHHFHLPLQSGSDAVLRRMDRPYTAAEYLAIVQELVRRFPDAAIGADLIAGFPGETEEEFGETLAFVARAPLTYLHVFSYSDRPGTKASDMTPKVPPKVIHDRSRRLRELGARKNALFCSKVRGTGQRALVLKERDAAGRLVGITGNYQEVVLEGSDELKNHLVTVRLEETLGDGRWAASLQLGGAPGGGDPASGDPALHHPAPDDAA
jgi:threonylcarbamoyladenosine tRNA methylthiotransferase MtaB